MSNPSQFQKFEMRVIDRRDIKLADYNPRTISDHARAQLKNVIQDVGLIQPLIWNERTGVLVSGHQRLATLDALEKYKPGGKKSYTLNVAVVNLDEKQERQMNVFLNNTSAMGEFDYDALNALIKDYDLNELDLGFSPEDIDVLFAADTPVELGDTAEAKRAKDTLSAIKEERKNAKEGLTEEQSIGYYFTVVCASLNAKETLLEGLGVPGYEEFIRGDVIATRCGISLEPPPPP